MIMGGEGFEPSKPKQQIYSLPPLATRESSQRMQSYHKIDMIAIGLLFFFENVFLYRWSSTFRAKI